MPWFNKVLTICKSCNKKITVEATYEERNNDFYCEDCLEHEKKFDKHLEDWAKKNL